MRVTAVGEHRLTDAPPRPGVGRQVGRRAPHEQLGPLAHPRVVGRDVVGDEVEDQPEPALRERRARRREPFGAAEPLRHRVVADAVRRADNVRLGEAGQRALEVGAKTLVAQGDRGPCWDPWGD